MVSTFNTRVPGVTILGPVTKAQEEILTPEAVKFVVQLHKAFNPTRKALLQARKDREVRIRNGELPDFLPETKAIRENLTWKGAPPAPGLVDRRVEITGPVDRKMVINALKAGSPTFMADFEDSTAPTWDNVLSGQINMRDAVNRKISYTAPNGKVYSIGPNDKVATLIVRPRGWHMEEKHFLIDNEPVSASLFDFALYFFHNAKNTLKIGAGPYFYLPKMESHLEARLWNNVFNVAQDTIGLPRGTIRATVLIETILAVFEMEEIIYELREHSSGLNCGRWDYIFSFIKKFRYDPKYVLPDRSDVTMATPFMRSYVQLLIQTCHRRGVHAMGGMAAQIPIKNDEKANNAALTKVRNDKLNEVKNGHDGTWVAHPALIPIAKEIFDKYMESPNQLYVAREDVRVAASQLIDSRAEGKITEQGVRSNISVGLTYIEAWLRGSGCVPIHNLMEDAATAEISRSQLWQWAHHKSVTAEGKVITPEYLNKILDEEIAELQQSLGARFSSTKYLKAKEFLASQMIGEEYSDFITTLLYDEITTISPKSSL